MATSCLDEPHVVKQLEQPISSEILGHQVTTVLLTVDLLEFEETVLQTHLDPKVDSRDMLGFAKPASARESNRSRAVTPNSQVHESAKISKKRF